MQIFHLTSATIHLSLFFFVTNRYITYRLTSFRVQRSEKRNFTRAIINYVWCYWLICWKYFKIKKIQGKNYNDRLGSIDGRTSVGVTLVMNSLTIQIKGRRFATFHQLEYAWRFEPLASRDCARKRAELNCNVRLPSTGPEGLKINQ